MSDPTALPLESRVLLRSALLLWLLAGLATVWEVLALQGPDSPVRLGVLAGPIGQLRGFSFALGAVLFGGAWAFPRLYAPGRGRVALVLLVLGALLHIAALTYAASQGMVGAQIFDPRPDALWVVGLRGLGHLAMLAALLDALVRAFRA
jgi:hypothetical protein